MELEFCFFRVTRWVLGQSDSYMVLSIPENIFSHKISCAFFSLSPQSATPSWCLYIYSAETNTFSAISGLNALLKGPSVTLWLTSSTPEPQFYHLVFIFIYSFYFSRPFTDTLPRHQFVPLLLCPLTVSSGLVIWPRPQISPGILMGLSAVMWHCLPSDKQLLRFSRGSQEHDPLQSLTSIWYCYCRQDTEM